MRLHDRGRKPRRPRRPGVDVLKGTWRARRHDQRVAGRSEVPVARSRRASAVASSPPAARRELWRTAAAGAARSARRRGAARGGDALGAERGREGVVPPQQPLAHGPQPWRGLRAVLGAARVVSARRREAEGAACTATRRRRARAPRPRERVGDVVEARTTREPERDLEQVHVCVRAAELLDAAGRQLGVAPWLLSGAAAGASGRVDVRAAHALALDRRVDRRAVGAHARVRLVRGGRRRRAPAG